LRDGWARIAFAVERNFELRDGVHERIRAVLDLAGKLDVGETRKDLLISDPQLHLCDA